MFIRIPDFSSPQFPYIRIDDEDTFSLDVTLASIIVPMLRHYKNASVGFPGDFLPTDHRQLCFDFIDADAEHEQAEKLWFAALDQMIAAFERFASDSGALLDDEAEKQVTQRGLDLFARYYSALWT